VELEQAKAEVNQAKAELNQTIEVLNEAIEKLNVVKQSSKDLAFKTTVEIAKNAYKEGLSISIIAKMTGLSEVEIIKLI
jgi:MoaA/NifB/PqqE/SkfB family radical SAM enzyme